MKKSLLEFKKTTKFKNKKHEENKMHQALFTNQLIKCIELNQIENFVAILMKNEINADVMIGFYNLYEDSTRRDIGNGLSSECKMLNDLYGFQCIGNLLDYTLKSNKDCFQTILLSNYTIVNNNGFKFAIEQLIKNNNKYAAINILLSAKEDVKKEFLHEVLADKEYSTKKEKDFKNWLMDLNEVKTFLTPTHPKGQGLLRI